MSIATEKVKLATERFMLVRLTPARHVVPVTNGVNYDTTFSYPIAKVERNGTVLTRVSTLVSNDQYTHNETTGVLEIKLASAPNSTTNIIVVYYYLFYTGTVFRSISQDPEDSATTVREWQPRIVSYPSISQSFDNIISGVFTISDTALEIINNEGQFQAFLTDNDSFCNKAVDIWLCISSVSNIQKIFTGTITGISMSQNTVTLQVVDGFNKLKQPAFMGDSEDEATFRRDSGSFPSLDPKHNNKPCPYIVGAYSRYQTSAQSGGPSGAPDPYLITVGTESFCTNFSANQTTSTNRQWGACRLKGSVATQSFGAVQAVLNASPYFFVRFASVSNVAIGDTIKWVESATTYYGVVNYVGTFTYSSVNYNIILSDPAGPFTLSSTVSNLKSFSVFIDAPNETLKYLMPRYERDYTVSETVTSGGNNYVYFTFVNNFEAGFAGYALLKPDEHQVYFRTSNDDVQTHGDILKDILETVGMTVDSATFTAADTALPVNARFHIPNFDEESADSYLKYAQDVLASTLGYLKINSDNEVQYNLLDAPTSSDIRDSFLILDNSLRAEVEYSDIITKIIGFNPHNDSGDAIDDTNTPAATAENNLSKFLNGITNVSRFRHVLEEFTSRVTDHMNVKSKRRVKYSFETATQDIDTDLGYDLQLENKIVLGGSGISDVKVVTLEKSPGKIFIEASDLKGL